MIVVACLLLALAASLAVAGWLTGYEDQVTNAWAWEIDRVGRGPETLALNRRWHRYAGWARLVATAIAPALAIALGRAAVPSVAAAVGLGVLCWVTFSASLNWGHNRSSGHPWYRAGEVAWADRLARRVGERLWAWASVAVLAVGWSGAFLMLG